VSDRAWQAIVTTIIGLALLIVVRIVLGAVFEHYVKRVATRKPPDDVARLRTRLMVLRRVIVAFVFVVVLWSVLEIFPTTEQVARTLLASGAFIALLLGVAFSVPLGNIGAGILLSLSQPVRIGDRITVGDVTGTAQEITLIHTILKTDQGLTAFVPNSQMITSTVVNRSLDDPRRLSRGSETRRSRTRPSRWSMWGRRRRGSRSVAMRRARRRWIALLPSFASGHWRCSPPRGSFRSSLASCAAFASRPARPAPSTSGR
jgi:small-conductance mechanosensitive channel